MKGIKRVTKWPNAIEVKHLDNARVIVSTCKVSDDDNAVFIAFKRLIKKGEDVSVAKDESVITIKDKVLCTRAGISKEAAFALLCCLQDYFSRIDKTMLNKMT